MRIKTRCVMVTYALTGLKIIRGMDYNVNAPVTTRMLCMDVFLVNSGHAMDTGRRHS